MDKNYLKKLKKQNLKSGSLSLGLNNKDAKFYCLVKTAPNKNLRQISY